LINYYRDVYFGIESEGNMKRIIVCASAIVLISLTTNSNIFAAGGDMGGPSQDGSQENPYLIEDVNDLDTFTSDNNYWDPNVHTKLMADLDLGGQARFAIAAYASYVSGSKQYKGNFNGNGCTISNFSINSGGEHLGFFGYIGQGGSVANLSLTDYTLNSTADYTGGLCGGLEQGNISDCNVVGNITGNYYVGGICGRSWEGTISNCNIIGNIGDEGGYIGGICGRNWGTIQNCCAHVEVSGDCDYMGGICGRNDSGISNITKCLATGNINSTGNAGGISGYNYGQIADCYATGDISGEADYVGGVCGYNSGDVLDSFATGNVTSTANYVGGICGQNLENITRCYAKGHICSTGSYTAAVGGACGCNGNIITNCYATGDASAPYSIGGFCGYNTNTATITNCYSTGKASGTMQYGGFCGNNMGSVIDCFWDTESSQMTSSDGGTGKTTTQMRTESTYTTPPVNWDFTDVWWINEQRDYPKLIWQPFGDINNDSFINLLDLGLMAQAWITNSEDLNYNSICELSGDTAIDTADLNELANMWLKGPQYNP
jgi:hypothetical protein